ncbi:MAG: S1C family serine protease [Mycobacteriaceae bacterium]
MSDDESVLRNPVQEPRVYPYPQDGLGGAAQNQQHWQQYPGFAAHYPTPPGENTLQAVDPISNPVTLEPRAKRTGLAIGAVALVLLGGAAGGGVATIVADRSDSAAPVISSLTGSGNVASVSEVAPGSVEAVAAKVLPSVVQIRVSSGVQGGTGSGVVLSDDGFILTNNHVVRAATGDSQISVSFSDGSVSSAKMVGADPSSDLAVIKAEGQSSLRPITIGSSSALKVGQSVVAVGSPLGLAGTVTTGIVSALNRPVSASGEVSNQSTVLDAIQTDAAINPGNSGGALVDAAGNLIGINSAIATLGGLSQGESGGSIGLGFAIPVDQAKRIANELIQTGKATRAALGVSISAQAKARGAQILDVTPEGAAAAAGIPKDALVTKVDDRIIDTGDALVAAIRSHVPGDKVTIVYQDTQGREKSVEVTLGSATS